MYIRLPDILKTNIMSLSAIFQILTTYQLLATVSSSAVFWKDHVYTGRHFDDLVTNTTVGPPKVVRPALLIIYNSKCEHNMRFLKDSILPPASKLVVAKHDSENFPSWVWYKKDDRDNFLKRYNPIRQCPEFLFFNNGSDLSEPIRHVEGKDKNIVSWLKDRMLIAFQVVNKRPKVIRVHFDSMTGPETPQFTVKPGESRVVKSYLSTLMYVLEHNYNFIYGTVIDGSTPQKVLIRTSTKMDDDKNLLQWIKDTKREVYFESARVRNYRHAIAALYLLNFKQPVLVHRFTKKGYEKTKIPDELFEALQIYYSQNQRYKVPEPKSVEPAINDMEVKPYSIILGKDIKQKIVDTIQPLLEEWCNAKLNFTTLFGIREYYRGNILRMHVDRIATHVVSVILQVHKNLDGSRDWPLEIIDYAGKRRNVYMNSGEMLFYESATLIHGRTRPLLGKSYANIFLHFSPIRGWSWKSEDGNIRHKNIVVDSVASMTPINHQYPNPKYYHDDL